jgi:hypothetical protein
MGRIAMLCTLVGIAIIAFPASVMGDYYDSFGDNNARGPDANYASCDPGLLFTYFDANYSWEIDNPQWWYFPIMAANGSFFDANSGSLRMFVKGGTMLPTLGISAMVPDNGDQDPATSPAYWDDTTNHYILVRVKYPGANLPAPYGDKRNDPNFDRGIAYIFMHGDPDTWTSLGFNIAFHNCSYYNANPNTPIGFEREHYWTEHLNLNYTSGANMYNIQRLWCDPNGVRPNESIDPSQSDPNDTVHLTPPENYGAGTHIPSMNSTKWLHYNFDAMERNGFWMLLQFEIDPNHAPGDPNGKAMKAAIWEGDKYAWDGTWDLNQRLTDPWWDTGRQGSYSYPAVAVGRCGLVSLSATPEMWGAGFPAAVEWDDVEARTDVWNGIPRQLDMTIKHDNWGTIKVAPDLRDASDDPNVTTERHYRFTDGTPIVLSATATVSKKVFDKWTIFDPNHPGDANFATTDSNAVLHLVMDKDYDIEASFKCASGLEPVLGLGLFALVLVAVYRRFA